MTAVSQQTGAWLEAFTNQPAAEPWIQALRDAAFARFAELGFPTTHDEEWRFTNVAPVVRTNFEVGQAIRLPVKLQVPLSEAEPHLARHASFADNPFVALNTAFLNDVTVIRVPKNTIMEEPIEITYEGDALASACVRAMEAAGTLVSG